MQLTVRVKKLFDFIQHLVVCCKTGTLEINFSQGAVTGIKFKENIILE